MSTSVQPSKASAIRVSQWIHDPVRFVREIFGVTPDRWQAEVLVEFPRRPRIAMRACKGPGKTAVLAWLAWYFLLTRPHPKIVATSITAENLADNFWTEMSKWQQRSELLMSQFTWTKTRIFSNDHPETWWMSARTWPKKASAQEQASTLAGLHADYVMFIVDESGDIPPAVLVSAEAALSSCVEGHIVQAGNTTSLEGMLYEATVTQRKNWFVVSITGDPADPKRSSRVSVEWAQALIDRWGRDYPYVLVNVFGQFPPSSFNALIGQDDIDAAQARSYTETDIERHPRILGVDVAFQGDDASVIFPRQGLVAFNPERHRHIDPRLGAGRVAARWRDWDADAVFIDNTGGFGASWISHLKLMGYAPFGVGFAESPNDEQFLNKRAEIYFNAAQWIKDGGQLPPKHVHGMAEFAAAMTRTTYTSKRDRLVIEPKELVKDKIGYSPDDADAFCLTFAQSVAPRIIGREKRGSLRADYQPIQQWDKSRGGLRSEYRPLAF